MRILIIEDDESHCVLIKAQLERPGVQFLEARRAQEGLRLAQEQRPDLILLDILMPPRNAWYVLEQLKRSPAYKDIPIIVVSILDAEGRCQALGADGFIHKPYHAESLRRQVSRCCGGYDNEEDTDSR